MDSKTWKKIDDFLVEAGATFDEESFLNLVTQRIGDFIPTDLPPAFLRIENSSGMYHHLIDWDEADAHLFNEKFSHRIMPFEIDYLKKHPIMDFQEFPQNELYIWLFRPKHIRWVLGTLQNAYFSLFRAKDSPAFSKGEVSIYLTISRHLGNLASFHHKLSCIPSQAISRAELAHDCRPLSRREAEIVRLLALRMTSREIASVLQISNRTVECHIQNAFEKLQVACRADLLAKVYHVDRPFISDT